MASSSIMRFATVVAKAGKPTPYLAWSAPAKDPHFKSALAQHKVMTIRQQLRGPHKDAGEVGYFPERNVQLLLFPRSLRRFEGKRIVGINYDLIGNEPTSGGKVTAPDRPKSVRRPVAKPKRVELEPAPTPRASDPPRAVETPVRGRKVVQFPQTTKATEPKPKRPLDPAVARQIQAALRELKAGKAVAAYERLNSLVLS